MRRLYFDIEKDARSKSETKAREDFDKEYLSISFDGGIGELMASKIYCLSDSVLNWERCKSE